MTEKTRKNLGEAKTAFEKRTLEYIEPILTTMNEEDIEGKKLTLAGCWKFCHGKGRNLAVNGCADISEKQERAWVREYFGIKGAPEPSEPESTADKISKLLGMDFGDMFD